MKILVPIKRTIDANVKVRVKADNSGVDLSNAKMAMNPFCEIAVEEAVRLKEQGLASEVIVVTVGEEKAQEQLRAAMALGADRGICISTDEKLEPLNIARVLQKIVDREQPQLIILGKQSIDDDNNQTGQMLAALCGYPQGTFAYKLGLNEQRLTVGREVDGGEQQVALTLPAVVTTDLRLNEPRYAKLPDIMKAKKKPVELIPLADLGLDLRPRTRVLSVTEPPGRTGCKILGSSAELVDVLRNVEKVIP